MPSTRMLYFKIGGNHHNILSTKEQKIILQLHYISVRVLRIYFSLKEYIRWEKSKNLNKSTFQRVENSHIANIKDKLLNRFIFASRNEFITTLC